VAAAQRIRELRLERELTQSQLARLLGVESNSVSRWENGEARPSALNRIRLGRIFNVRPDEFANESNEAVA
jgi:transcriptional regulator with XRE-family HTH domain